jgi:hypothetical protein
VIVRVVAESVAQEYGKQHEREGERVTGPDNNDDDDYYYDTAQEWK